MDCLSDNDLAELLEDRLAAPQRAAALAELERCAECRELARQWALASIDPARGATTAPSVAEAGAQLGPFRLDRLIGVGAMGLVFRGHDPTLARDVAIKVVRATDADARARALAEGRLLATVRHPAVIAVHAAGVGDGVVYLAMELVDGHSLDRALATAPLPWLQAARWFAAIAGGLAAAHAVGVIHRDVKPANLLVDGTSLRLADFGLATTDGGAPAGTPAYAAPELRAGAAATPASDQYALCVALFESVTGRRPFADDPRGEARSITWTDVPSRLRPVLARGLAPRPDDRWPDLRAVEHALLQVATRRRWPWIGAGLAATAALTIGGLALARPGAARCEIPQLGWSDRVAQAPLPLARAIAATEARWRDGFARACAAGAAAELQQRCLRRGRQRIESLLDAADPRDPSTLRALLEAPGPEPCLTGRDDEVAHASEAVRRAAAERALGRPRVAWSRLPPAPADDDAALALLRGELAHELQDLPAAEAALTHAIERAAAGLDSIAIDAQLALATVIGFDQDRHEAGAAYVRAASALAQRRGDVERAAQAELVAGLIASARGDRPAAITAITAAIAALERGAAAPLVVAQAELRLGWVLREAGRPEARAHLDRARALRVAALGADHPAVAIVEVELGMLDAAAGRYAEAIARYQTIVAGLVAAIGDARIELAAPLSALGAAQLASGDYTGARASFERALALRQAAFGERHLDVARAHVNLATTAYYAGDVDRAITHYRAAEASARSLLGGEHPEVATIGAGLALALQRAGRHDEADAAITDAIAIYRRRPGHDLELADALMTQGMLAFEAERLPAARAAFDASYALARAVRGDDHVDLAPILSILGELALAQHRLADADAHLTRARQLRVEHGAAPQLLAETDYLRALVAWQRGAPREARALARAARALLGDARPELADAIAAWLRQHGG